jgi:hypothetical protein
MLSNALTPTMIVRHLRHGNVGRAAMVHERNEKGEVVAKLLDVRDVEERKPECKEIVVVDEATEKKILRTLTVYRYSLLYLAVMVTIGVLLLLLELIFN